MKSKTQILNDLNRMRDFIEEAMRQLDHGTIVSLSHLDDEVEALCEQIIALPRSEAEQVQPAMGDMIAQLDRLGQRLKTYQSSLKDRL